MQELSQEEWYRSEEGWNSQELETPCWVAAISVTKPDRAPKFLRDYLLFHCLPHIYVGNP